MDHLCRWPVVFYNVSKSGTKIKSIQILYLCEIYSEDIFGRTAAELSKQVTTKLQLLDEGKTCEQQTASS